MIGRFRVSRRRVVVAIAGLMLVGLVIGGFQIYGWVTARGDDTWIFAVGHGWAQDTKPGPAPSMRTDSAMAYSPALKHVILFGGRPVNRECCYDDTWAFGGSDWVQQTTSIQPPGRAAAAMALFPTSGDVILFGGNAPPPLFNGPVPADYTGELDDTWAFSDAGWRPITTLHRPPPREGAAFAFDKGSGRMILFGGSTTVQGGGGQPMLSDTWGYDGTDWTQLSPVVSPPGRAYAAFSPDPAGGVLLFGGTSGSGPGTGLVGLDDAWRWKDGAWGRVDSSGPRPPGRLSAASASSDNWLLVFGGRLGCGTDHSSRGCSTNPDLGDTWVWDGHGWRENVAAPIVSTQPRSRVGASLCFDISDGVFVLFGGPDPHNLSGL